MKIDKAKFEEIIYGSLIKDAQLILDSKDVAEVFKVKPKADRVEIKKKILTHLKGLAKEVSEKVFNGQASADFNNAELKAKLKSVIRRCLNEEES